jgi:hypothetical protein
MSSQLSTFDEKLHLALELCHLFLTKHSGICGFMCLARAFGFSDWKAFIRYLKDIKDDPIFTAASRRLINGLAEVNLDDPNISLDSSLYVNCDLRKFSIINCLSTFNFLLQSKISQI